ncbi:HD-GYP domain-containing protein [Cohnella lubricantis]|uniref:HD-GYP domain-containing protein n=1 Tax=Cohnella lubricantis TaxID=2163172 RepID=A0A841T8A5_9BACL|nr:HD-GYP domain-containing protein [Cohnella lubricantis]MBB6677544.1 HD-GYP domain-containing protein [Cohnella lubricantis]MBP2116570.1 putative nucleotidyltransferase with HDIG domain [Cohnella lubricantis]
MRVSLSDLQPGDCLAEDIFTNQGLHVLSKGTFLQEKDLARLRQLHVQEVEIQRRSGAALEAQASQGAIPSQQSRIRPYYDNAVTGYEAIFKKALEIGRVLDSEVEASFGPLVDNIQKERDVISLLLLLNNQDEYTYQHSVQVGMLSFFLAHWLGWSDEEANHAGKAGFLHDIGKTRVPESILTKPAALTEEEMREIRRHPEYGYEILLASFGDPIIAEAALQHHERMDGTGYPNQLPADSIRPMSRVVSVADVYSAMITSRPYREKVNMLTVLKELYRLSFKELDPHMTLTFIRHMLPNFIGKRVTMRSGETGTIIMNHPTLLFNPLVQVGEQFIDTSIHPQNEIQLVYL